jgi:hypothetical protein
MVAESSKLAKRIGPQTGLLSDADHNPKFSKTDKAFRLRASGVKLGRL